MNGTTKTTSSTSAPPISPASVRSVMPHFAAYFSTVGYQPGSAPAFAISRSSLFARCAGFCVRSAGGACSARAASATFSTRSPFPSFARTPLSDGWITW